MLFHVLYHNLYELDFQTIPLSNQITLRTSSGYSAELQPQPELDPPSCQKSNHYPLYRDVRSRCEKLYYQSETAALMVESHQSTYSACEAYSLIVHLSTGTIAS